MQHMTSGLSRSVGKWVAQVAASVGATLVATMIYGALPKASAPPSPELAEVTSGGKFAARAVRPVADDGLDTMPLPHVAPMAFVVSTMPADPAPTAVAAPPTAALHQALWTGTAPLVPERTARSVRPAHPAAPRIEVKRVLPVNEPAAPPAAPAETASDDGLMVKVASTARGAWSLTASAGDALMARVIPQIP